MTARQRPMAAPGGLVGREPLKGRCEQEARPGARRREAGAGDAGARGRGKEKEETKK